MTWNEQHFPDWITTDIIRFTLASRLLFSSTCDVLIVNILWLFSFIMPIHYLISKKFSPSFLYRFYLWGWNPSSSITVVLMNWLAILKDSRSLRVLVAIIKHYFLDACQSIGTFLINNKLFWLKKIHLSNANCFESLNILITQILLVVISFTIFKTDLGIK